MKAIEKPPVMRTWARCPGCGAKLVLFDNTASCRGVFVKCTRGCGREVELIIVNGEQAH